jgi:hypothetical protein
MPDGAAVGDEIPEFITCQELARRIHVHPETVYRQARAGQVPGSSRMGTRVFINWTCYVETTKTAPAA